MPALDNPHEELCLTDPTLCLADEVPGGIVQPRIQTTQVSGNTCSSMYNYQTLTFKGWETG